MNVAIVGCGLIGQRRARALAGARLVACTDRDGERAITLARQMPGVDVIADWRSVIARPDVDILVVSTTHDALAEITRAAVEHGKHVLVEKPAARRAAELEEVIRAAERYGRLVRVGFNHRYHAAFRKMREIVDSGGLGELLYARGRYGHGGRPGYEREWRARPELSGGGELIDQGVHLIDLARWFLGDFSELQGVARTYFWAMPVEDNGFMLLTTERGQVAFLHASCTEWKNLFSFELFGRYGKLEVNGLGGSYGIERLAHYQMRPEMGPPDTAIWEYPMADRSWEIEFAEFLDDIHLGRPPAAGLRDAQAALTVVERIYEGSVR
jgi:predicted dehydrogenase